MKNNSEIRAGRVGPPWQQNPIVGAYTGTYDVVVEDKFEEDMKLFISEYPALKNVKVDKSILPQWDKDQRLSNKLSIDALGMTYTHHKTTIIDTCESLIGHGLIKDKRKK